MQGLKAASLRKLNQQLEIQDQKEATDQFNGMTTIKRSLLLGWRQSLVEAIAAIMPLVNCVLYPGIPSYHSDRLGP